MLVLMYRHRSGVCLLTLSISVLFILSVNGGFHNCVTPRTCLCNNNFIECLPSVFYFLCSVRCGPDHHNHICKVRPVFCSCTHCIHSSWAHQLNKTCIPYLELSAPSGPLVNCVLLFVCTFKLYNTERFLDFLDSRNFKWSTFTSQVCHISNGCCRWCRYHVTNASVTRVSTNGVFTHYKWHAHYFIYFRVITHFID